MGGRQQQLQQQQHRRRRRRRRWKNQCVHFFTREKRASCEAKKHAETICSIYLVWRLSESDAINIKCNQNNKMHPYERIEISQWLSVRTIKNASERKKKHRTMWNTFWLCVAMNLNYHQALSVVQYIVCITVMHMEHLWTWVWVCVTLFVHVRARNDVCFLFFDLFNFFCKNCLQFMTWLSNNLAVESQLFGILLVSNIFSINTLC